jgi:SAM-dependent methyltransferase
MSKTHQDKTHNINETDNLKIDAVPEKNNYYRAISDRRWNSYFWQLFFIANFRPKSILEIGAGDKIVADIMKKLGYNVKTCDISANVNPDYVADIRSLPFEKESFDMVVCFQILEHIEYEYFVDILKSLHRITRKHVILSLPQIRKFFALKIHIPWMKTNKNLTIFKDFPRYPYPLKPSSSQHLWEIGMQGFPLPKIIRDIEKSGFKILINKSSPESNYHRFFILEKNA